MAASNKEEQYTHTTKSGMAQFRAAFADSFVGKELTFEFDDGNTLVYRFTEMNRCEWSENGGDFFEEYVECLESTVKSVFAIHHFRHTNLPFEGEMIIADMDSGLVTWVSLQFGKAVNDKDISRIVHFGVIKMSLH